MPGNVFNFFLYQSIFSFSFSLYFLFFGGGRLSVVFQVNIGNVRSLNYRR